MKIFILLQMRTDESSNVNKKQHNIIKTSQNQQNEQTQQNRQNQQNEQTQQNDNRQHGLNSNGGSGDWIN